MNFLKNYKKTLAVILFILLSAGQSHAFNLQSIFSLFKKAEPVKKSVFKQKAFWYYAAPVVAIGSIIALIYSCRNRETPLYTACKKGDIAAVKLLLKNGAKGSINKAHNYGWTPLHWACYKNNIEIVRLLLDKGADINKACNDGRTPLYLACFNNNIEIVRLLLEKGADANKASSSALHWACYNNNLEMVRLLLDNGADINKADNQYGRTPLYMACRNSNNLEIVRLLLEKGADINKADNDGRTPLYLACYNNNLEIVRLLLDKGADINKADNDGRTPLYLACHENNIEIVRLLLEKGADINQGSLEQLQNNLQNPVAQQILDMFNLTQRFDKWIKVGEFFGLTAQESLEDGLSEFTGRLLQSKRKEIIRNREPKKSLAKTIAEEKYRRLDDCAVICKQERYI